MLPRLSRARVPLSRYLQTQSVRPPSKTTKYVITVATFATVAFLGTQWNPLPIGLPTIALDSVSRDFNTPAAQPKPIASTSKSTVVKKGLEEEPTSAPRSEEPLQEIPTSKAPSEPEPAQETDGEADTGGDSGGGAFNPETGEINWDCPCLGGMAHGPCGPEFREAFSCFVHSEDEPKGINCVEKFQGMQTCFREHPEVYASEIADDEEAEAAEKEGSLPATDNEKEPASRTDVPESAPPSPSAPAPKPSEENLSSQ
ncbi:hypothetical protein C8R44DRAFT_812484 [Mycena epipterygia]|nr:hypothetical protein C8R44DRAFT_812484 [Mycena epipterygia]